MNWSNFALRVVFVAIVCLVMFAWVIPAFVAILIAIIPPASAIAGAITLLLKAAVALWGLYHAFRGSWPSLP